MGPTTDPGPAEGTRAGSLREYFVRGASGTLGLQACSTVLTVLISFILARALGAEGLGLYVYAMSWVLVLTLLTLLGFDRLLVREASALLARREWGRLAGMLRFTTKLVTAASCTVALVAAGVAWIVGGFHVSQQLLVFWICLPVVPLEALLHLRLSAVRGFQRVVLAALPAMLFRPLAFAILVGVAALTLGRAFTASSTAVLQVVAAAAAVLLSAVILRRTLPPEVCGAAPQYERGGWLKGAMPFLVMGGLSALLHRLDILMLGAIRGPEEAGIYAVAQRAAGMLTLVLAAANAPLGPLISRLNVRGEFARMQLVVTKTARVILAASIPLAAVLILFRHPLLRLFGAEFTAGETTLVILTAGQVVNLGMGSVGVILNMTRHEGDVVRVFALGTVLNILLNAILIPRYGIEGAAIATAASTCFWNVLLAVKVWRRLGISTTALGPLGRRRSPPGDDER